MADAPAMSKSARQRANKKARDAAAAAEAPAPVPVAAPLLPAKAKAKAKAAAAAAPPPEPEPAPKAKAKAKAKAESGEQPKAKAKAKSKAAAAPPPEAPKKVEEELPPGVTIDDGTGGDWEVADGMSKKQKKKKEKTDGGYPAESKQGGGGQKLIPGQAPEGKGSGKGEASSLKLALPGDVPWDRTKTKKAEEEEEKKPAAPVSVKTIDVPEKKIGIVIGPKGAKIQLIQTECSVKIDTDDGVFTISGPPEGVNKAYGCIKDLIEKGYTKLGVEDFEENFVAVLPKTLPDLIGKKGAIIMKMKDACGVEINIPQVPPNPPYGKKYKVTIGGPKAGVEKAKECINSIVMYYHHEITHEGQAHEELVDVKAIHYRFLIGKAGSELKHIQNSYNVRLYIPREDSVNTNVVIVGLPKDITNAKSYIENMIWKAENSGGGRGRDGDAGEGDVWGDESEEEDWMKQYIKKR